MKPLHLTGKMKWSGNSSGKNTASQDVTESTEEYYDLDEEMGEELHADGNNSQEEDDDQMNEEIADSFDQDASNEQEVDEKETSERNDSQNSITPSTETKIETSADENTQETLVTLVEDSNGPTEVERENKTDNVDHAVDKTVEKGETNDGIEGESCNENDGNYDENEGDYGGDEEGYNKSGNDEMQEGGEDLMGEEEEDPNDYEDIDMDNVDENDLEDW